MGDSGGSRFATIDVKLANALNAMSTSSGDSGREVGQVRSGQVRPARNTHEVWIPKYVVDGPRDEYQ